MFAKNFIKLHQAKNMYEKTNDLNVFTNVEGWVDYILSENLIFSHRNNYFTKSTFTEKMHSHEYYELVIYLSGDIEYINETHSFKPIKPCAVWFKPFQMHTARLVSPCVYERVVFYFSPEFFLFNNQLTPINDFMNDGQSFAINLNQSLEIIEILQEVENALTSNKPYAKLLASAYTTLFFAMLDKKNHPAFATALNDKISKVKHYIDCEYASIKSVEQISNHFGISREHLSRQFKQKFNVNISDYITNRRITQSLKLIKYNSVSDTAYSVGYNSLSAFICAFKSQTGYKPLEYKKLNT